MHARCCKGDPEPGSIQCRVIAAQFLRTAVYQNRPYLIFEVAVSCLYLICSGLVHARYNFLALVL